MNEKHSSILIWLIAYLLIGALLVVLLYFIDKEGSWVEWVSIIGSYSSVFGLVVMAIQFKSVRETTEKTKEKLDSVSLISEWSKATELLRSAETDIERDDISVACFKLRRVKDLVIQSMSGEAAGKDCEKSIKKLNENISLLNQYLLQGLDSGNGSYNKQEMLDGLELISDVLNKRISHNIDVI